MAADSTAAQGGTPSTVKRFNYDKVPVEHRDYLSLRSEYIQNHFNNSVAEMLEIAKQMVIARDIGIDDALFEEWIKAELPFSRRTAFNLIAVGRQFAKIEFKETEVARVSDENDKHQLECNGCTLKENGKFLGVNGRKWKTPKVSERETIEISAGTIDMKALYCLASREVPDSACDEALARAQSGEKINYQIAREIKNRHMAEFVQETDNLQRRMTQEMGGKMPEPSSNNRSHGDRFDSDDGRAYNLTDTQSTPSHSARPSSSPSNVVPLYDDEPHDEAPPQEFCDGEEAATILNVQAGAISKMEAAGKLKPTGKVPSKKRGERSNYQRTLYDRREVMRLAMRRLKSMIEVDDVLACIPEGDYKQGFALGLVRGDCVVHEMETESRAGYEAARKLLKRRPGLQQWVGESGASGVFGTMESPGASKAGGSTESNAAPAM